jgi:P-type Cu2+ transporter
MPSRCLHCEQPLSAGEDRFCCAGCEAANSLLRATGLERYYELRQAGGVDAAPLPAGNAAPERDELWLTLLEAELRSDERGVMAVELDLQGLRCAACVWVIEQLFARAPGAAAIEVNPGVGKVLLEIEPRVFPLATFAHELAGLGYRLAPSSKRGERREASGLLIRLGVCAAVSANVMLFSFALHSGLTEGPLHTFMLWGGWALTAVAVAVGGAPFFRSAWASLRLGALHLDVPIALGIALAFAGSTYSLLAQGGRASYFDTVASFVTLMLFGRFLQERVLEQNRLALLADDGVEGLLCSVVRGGQVTAARVGDVRPGETLLLRPGDLVPVDARLVSPAATSFSREWITGESSVATAREGDAVEAGSFHAGRAAATAVAVGDFASSRLSQLLRRPAASPPIAPDRSASLPSPLPSPAADAARRTPFWQTLARYYVAATLAVAAGSGLLWAATSSASRAIEVVVAVLVVTCPCAFGIAVPVAYELVQARLRREGVFVRSASLLDRAVGVEKIVFDKTGTLTMGTLELASAAPLLSLSEADRRALFQMAVRSSHPKSRAVCAALSGRGYTFDPALVVDERAGLGLGLSVGGVTYRLGALGWACGLTVGSADAVTEGADLIFARTGDQPSVLAALVTREVVRREAGREIAALGRAGYEVHLLSGDAPARVAQLASALGVPASRACASASPEQKRAYVEREGASRVLMVGDGVNDAAALSAALCSATPAGDMPFLPARTDAYIQGALVTGVRRLLSASRLLSRVVSEAVAFGVAYNAAAVGAACGGLMTPLVAAILMPLSSLAVVGWVVFRLGAPRAERGATAPLAAPATATGVSLWK